MYVFLQLFSFFPFSSFWCLSLASRKIDGELPGCQTTKKRRKKKNEKYRKTRAQLGKKAGGAGKRKQKGKTHFFKECCPCFLVSSCSGLGNCLSQQTQALKQPWPMNHKTSVYMVVVLTLFSHRDPPGARFQKSVGLGETAVCYCFCKSLHCKC